METAEVMITRIALTLVLVGAASQALQPAIASELTILVVPERLQCFVQNYENYLNSEEDPVLIFLNACPRTAPNRQEILAMSMNSMPDLKKMDPAAPVVDSVLALRKDEIRCLVEGLKSDKIKPVAVKDSKGQDAVRLTLSGC